MNSIGLIFNIKENEIYHSCNTDNGSSGSPILSLKTNKVIGVHFGSSKNFQFNLGSLIIYAIKEFNKTYYKKSNSIMKIKNEIQFIQNFPFTNIGIHIELPKEDNDIFEWRGFLIGPNDTPYKGGIFNFKILFPFDFPESSPQVIFLNPIYHLNVNHKNQKNEPLGRVCTSIFNFWNGKMTIREILTKLYLMFYLNNPDNSPFDIGKANEIKNNRALLDKKIKYFTEKYANPISASQKYDNWDFIYNEYLDDNNNINIIFELDGINRHNFQAHKKEKAKNVVQRYCNSLGLKINSVKCFHNSKSINLDKTIEENGIGNNSLITIINSYNVLFC